MYRYLATVPGQLESMSQSLPTQLKVLQAISEVPEAAWNALVGEEAAPFLEWRWLEALEGSGSVAEASGWEPRHLTLWRGHRLVAAAPAYRKSDSSGEFVFDFSWATASERAGVPYYPKLVIAAPLTPATGRRFLVAPGEDPDARLLELARGALELAREERLSSVHVLFPTEAEAVALEPLGFAVRQGVQYHFLNEGYRTPDDVLQRFNSKRRNQLKRERRAPSEQGLTRPGPAGRRPGRGGPQGDLPAVRQHRRQVRLGTPLPEPPLLRPGAGAVPAPGGARAGAGRRPRGGRRVQPGE